MASSPSAPMAAKYKKIDVPDQYCDTVFHVIMTDPVTLPCKHRFNKQQIMRWVANPAHSTCPLCRGAGSPVTDDKATRTAVTKWLFANFPNEAYGHLEGLPLDA